MGAHVVRLGEGALSYALSQYLSHYHAERNHQGLSNQLIAPEPGMGSDSGQVMRRERLGGLLSYYSRDAGAPALLFNHTRSVEMALTTAVYGLGMRRSPMAYTRGSEDDRERCLTNAQIQKRSEGSYQRMNNKKEAGNEH